MGNRMLDRHQRHLQRDCDSAAPALQYGRLIPTPIHGISYRTATQRGLTDRHGTFIYLPGESITLFIGAVDLPTALCSGQVTPYDMGDSPGVAINVVRLLCAICSDYNGTLSLPAHVVQLATSPIDFHVKPALFAHQAAVANLLDGAEHQMMDECSATDWLDSRLAGYLIRTCSDR